MTNTKNLVGPSLLVAPVFVPKEEETEYYIPAGRWTSFFHPERTVDGPVWITEIVPLDEIPVWVRPGTILLLGPERTGRPDYDYTQGLEVQIYELAEGQTIEADVPLGKGAHVSATIRVERKSGEIKVNVLNGASSISSINLFGANVIVKDIVGGVIGTGSGPGIVVEKGRKEVIIHVA